MELVHLFAFFLALGLATSAAVEADENREKRSDESDEEASLKREKRCCQFGWVVGETILDIQCKRGYLTVCAPDGPDACPVGYNAQTNVGQCGFATLNHYLNTTNIAGTCCYKLPNSLTTSTTSATGSGTTAGYLIPQIIAYPVYAQYPYAVGGNTNTQAPSPGSSYGGSSSYGSSPASSYSAPSPMSSYSAPAPSSMTSYSSSNYGR